MLGMAALDVAAVEILETLDSYTLENNALEQINSVSQFRDVFPGDWAFEALRNLSDRYNCIVGYPNGTYRGDRTMSRYEFAAGLNACLGQIERLLQDNNFAFREDLEILTRLMDEFAEELAVLGTRVDGLEGRVAFLEDHQFSTTTKLRGEVMFAASGVFGNEKADGSGDAIDSNIVFNDRVRLNFDTSFTGRDLLRVRLDALNPVPFAIPVTGTNMTRLAAQRNNNNDFDIGKLFYRVPISKKFRLHLDATGGRYNFNVDNFNRFFANGFTGSISRFGRFNPIYIQGAGGGGVTGNYKFSDSLSFSLGYLARNASDAEDGLFNGSYAALAQLDIAPSDRFRLGLTYVRAYYPAGEAFVSGVTGTRLANAPFGTLPTSADHFGFQSSFRVSPDFTLSGWAGLTRARAETSGTSFGGTSVNQSDRATIFNWAISLAFPDVGKENSLLGFVIGNPPRVTDNDSGLTNSDTSWHLEAFYRYPLTDNISINPGFLVVLNPEGSSDNDPIYVGTIRTVFRF